MGKCSYFPFQTRVRPKSAIYTAERVHKHPRDPLQSLLWELAPDILLSPGGVTSGNILIWLGTCRWMTSLDTLRGIFVLSSVNKVYQFHWKLSEKRAGVGGDCWVKK